MTHRWNQTININENIARELIETQQNLRVESIIKLEEGWDNIAYLVNHHFIFRFPRREFGINCMENEIAVVPHIAQHIHFPISAPLLIGKPSELYPYSYAGYPMLSGVPLTEAHDALIDDKLFAETISVWLRELHAVPVDEKHRIALKDGAANWRIDFEFRSANFKKHMPQYAHHFQAAGFDLKQLQNICDILESFQFDKHECFIHGDLYHRHLLVDNHLKPTGVIDWGDVQIGHPGVDLGIGFIFSPKTFEHFLKCYGNINEEIFKATLFNAFFGSISFLPYAFERNVPSFKHWAIMGLQREIEEIKKL